MNGNYYGRITQVDPEILVQIPGFTNPVHLTNIAKGYHPAVDDRVYLIELAESQWLIAGAYERTDRRS